MKIVVIDYAILWEAHINIDVSEKTTEHMKSQIMFFSGAEDRIKAEGGDIEKAYLKMIAPYLIYYSIECSMEGVIAKFEEMEGFLTLNGEYGITLSFIENFEFEPVSFSITSDE